jgi:hypothetical protein
MQNNSINSQTDIANVTVVTEENQIIVPQPITNVVEVNNPGPQGPVGPQGATGPSGSTQPFSNISGSIWATTSSLQVSGSFLVSGSSTFTNIGPAIFSGSANIVGATTMSSAVVSGNVTVLGTASIGTLVVNQTVLSTGSNQLGDSANDTQTLYGTVRVPTGSLTVSGSTLIATAMSDTFNAPLVVQNLTPYSNLFNQMVQMWKNSAGTMILGLRADGFFELKIGGIETPSLTVATNGSAAAPVLTRSNNNTTGIFFPATNNIAISTNGTEALRILANGNVGIGNTAPDYPLHITRNSTNNYIQLSGNTMKGIFAEGSGLIAFDTAGNLGIYTGGVNLRATFTSSGSLGIGTSTPSASLHIKGATTSSLSSSFLVQDSNASASFIVRDDGRVGIGTNNPQALLDLYGTSFPQIWIRDTSGVIANLYAASSVAIVGSVSNHPVCIRTNNNNSVMIWTNNGMSIGGSYINAVAPANGLIVQGNTGIGTNSPLFILDVSGSARLRGSGSSSATSALTVQNSSGTTLLSTRDDGLVTVGFQGWLGIGETGRYLYRALNATGIFTIANDSTVGSSIDMFGSSHATLPNVIRVTAPSGIQITGSLTISGSTPSIQLGTSAFVGDFTNPAITLGSTSNGIYLDSSRILFKAGGVFVGGFSSDGYLTNQIQIRGTLFNDLTTAMFIPYRLNAIGFSSGLGGDSTGAVTLITSGSSRLYVSSSGNVGIGTTTPSSSLHIGPNTGTLSTGLTFGTGTSGIWLLDNTVMGIKVANADRLWIRTTDFYPDSSMTLGLTNRRWTALYTAQITDTGTNVGIGNPTPSASLHISGSSSSGLFKIDSPAVNNILYVSGSGNVGVGTNNPVFKLDVSNPSGYSAIGIQTSASTNAELQFKNAAYSLPRWTVRATSAADGSSGNLTFQRLANTFPMTITSGDNVLIGTSVDSARLMVKGSGTTSASTTLRVENTNASASLVVRDDGSTLFVGSNGTTGTWIDDTGSLTIYRSTFGTTYGLRVYNGAGWGGHNAIQALAYQYPIYGAQGANGVEQASPLNAGAGVYGQGGVGVYGKGVTPAGDTGSIGVMATSLYVQPTGNTALYNRSASMHIIGTSLFSGSLTVTGSATISNILTLTPQSPLPSGVATGSFAVSSSVPPKPYFYDGTTWNALY